MLRCPRPHCRGSVAADDEGLVCLSCARRFRLEEEHPRGPTPAERRWVKWEHFFARERDNKE